MRRRRAWLSEGRRRSPTRYARRLLSGDVQTFLQAVLGRRGISALRAVMDGPVVVTMLKRRGLRPLAVRLRTWPSADVHQARLVSQAVDAGLAMWPIAFTCLRRSVVLLRELDRLRMGAELRIGVRPGPEGVEAHAWVQVDDHVVNDDAKVVRTYAELPLYEADSLHGRFA